MTPRLKVTQHRINVVDTEVRDKRTVVKGNREFGTLSVEAQKLGADSVSLSADTTQTGERRCIATHDGVLADHLGNTQVLCKPSQDLSTEDR